MENFINLLSDVWNRGFYGFNLSDIIISLIVLLAFSKDKPCKSIVFGKIVKIISNY